MSAWLEWWRVAHPFGICTRRIAPWPCGTAVGGGPRCGDSSNPRRQPRSLGKTVKPRDQPDRIRSKTARALFVELRRPESPSALMSLAAKCIDGGRRCNSTGNFIKVVSTRHCSNHTARKAALARAGSSPCLVRSAREGLAAHAQAHQCSAAVEEQRPLAGVQHLP